jgi:hypothetical protein
MIIILNILTNITQTLHFVSFILATTGSQLLPLSCCLGSYSQLSLLLLLLLLGIYSASLEALDSKELLLEGYHSVFKRHSRLVNKMFEGQDW